MGAHAARKYPFAIDEKGQQHHEERRSREDNATEHGLRENEIGRVAGRFAHDGARRGQRRQGHGRESVHDEVDPENLRHGQWQFGAHQRTGQHEQQGRQVDDELEIEKPLDVLVEGASPHDGIDNGAEGVVEQRHVAGLLGHAGARSERQAHVGMVQGGRVVGAVARHGYDFAVPLQHFHQPLLVRRTGAAHHLDGGGQPERVLVGERSPSGAGD